MKFIYPAVIRKTQDGLFHARMADLEGCEAQGDTVDEVMENINEAMFGWISAELEEEEPVLPRISDTEDITLQEGEFIRNVCVTMRFFEGWDE